MQCGFPLFFLAVSWVTEARGGAFSPVYSIPCTLFRKCFYLFGGEYPPFVGKTLSFAHSFINNVVVIANFQWTWVPTYNFSQCSSIMGRSRGERGAAWVGLISQLDFKAAHRADLLCIIPSSTPHFPPTFSDGIGATAGESPQHFPCIVSFLLNSFGGLATLSHFIEVWIGPCGTEERGLGPWIVA